MLLRAGMRLSEVDNAKAKSTVAAAFAGGIILVNADNAIVRHDGNYPNLTANVLNSTEAANFYLAKPFVDACKKQQLILALQLWPFVMLEPLQDRLKLLAVGVN